MKNLPKGAYITISVNIVTGETGQLVDHQQSIELHNDGAPMAYPLAGDTVQRHAANLLEIIWSQIVDK